MERFIPSFNEKRYTFFGIASNLGLVGFLVVFIMGQGLGGVLGSFPVLAAVSIFLASVVVLAVVVYLSQSAVVKAHAKTVAAQAESRGWEYESYGGAMSVAPEMALALIVSDDRSTAKLYNYVKTDDWSYCDYVYDFYHRTKYGRYKAGQKSYAVMSVTLPRALPTILFDSARSKRKQFSQMFASNQQLSLEGDFDSYFTTYVPEQYRIDSLSFITPEVMESLIRASEYDIEIIHDTLYLFAPIRSGAQVINMAERAMDIKRMLLNNIVTYRDERVPYEQGRSVVAPNISNLRRSKMPLYITIAIVIAIMLLNYIPQFWGYFWH